MGMLNRMFGGANGVRETMHVCYANHVADIVKRRICVPTGSDPHYFGLYGAMATRYEVHEKLAPESLINVEIAPFCAMDDKELAVAMLAEYVVYRETPVLARTDLLSRVLGAAVGDVWGAPWLEALVLGIDERIPWSYLLAQKTIYVLRARYAASAQGSFSTKGW